MTDSQHVIMIDDEEIQCGFFSEYLRSKNYEVTSFVCSLKALEYFKEAWKDIDLVILDIGMPNMDGHEVLMMMQEINPEVKVLFSTGYNAKEEFAKIKDKKKVEGVLQKPYKPEILMQHVTVALKKK